MSTAITPQKSLWNSLETHKVDLARVLPPHLSVDRFFYQVRMAIAKQPKLANCTPASVLEAVRVAADLGLDPSGALGSAWLVPYKDKCELIPGYRGLIDLACRSGFVKSANAWVINERDQWEAPLAGRVPKHRPFFPMPDDEQQDPGRVIGAWSRIKLNALGDDIEVEVMTLRQLDAIRARSASVRAGKMDSPWFTNPEEMYRKTVLRRLLKKAPLSPIREVNPRQAAYQERFVKAVEIDDAEFESPPGSETPADPKKGAAAAKARLAEGGLTPFGPMSDSDKAVADALEREPGSGG